MATILFQAARCVKVEVQGPQAVQPVPIPLGRCNTYALQGETGGRTLCSHAQPYHTSKERIQEFPFRTQSRAAIGETVGEKRCYSPRSQDRGDVRKAERTVGQKNRAMAPFGHGPVPILPRHYSVRQERTPLFTGNAVVVSISMMVPVLLWMKALLFSPTWMVGVVATPTPSEVFRCTSWLPL